MEISFVDNAFSKAHRRHNRLLQAAQSDDEDIKYTTSCKTCLIHLRLLNSPPTPRAEKRLSRVDYLAQGSCIKHKTIFPVDYNSTVEEIWLSRPAQQRLIYVYPDPYRNEQNLALEAPWEGLDLDKSISTFNTQQPQPRIVDQSWINLNLLKHWLHKCEESHGNSCGDNDFESTEASYPSLLVDTDQNCLVQASSCFRYLALSYVWGNANAFLTTMANCGALSVPGALTKTGEFAVQIPQTIYQAMALTHALGERYLWVDALCIIQDGHYLVDELNKMASTFAKATLTIVAAQGQHADSGFRGLPNISQPRHIQQHVAPLAPEQHLVRPSSKQVWDDALLQPWSARAWTFQEAICSRRMLYFAHDSVRWSCREARWSEESNSSDCIRSYSTVEQRRRDLASPQLSKLPLPMLDEYVSLINRYNTRSLTYREDVLSAFAGVATRLGEKFSGGLISGLPELFFDICLLWRPMRRVCQAILRETNVPLNKTRLPSWSWAGWVTEITLPYTWIRHRDPAGPLPVLIGSIRPFYKIEMHYLDRERSNNLITNEWLDFASSTKELNLPSGWSSHKISNAADVQDYGLSKGVSYFTHSHDPSVQFWFPVPLDTKSKMPRTPKFLRFKTFSGMFRLGESRRIMTRIYSLAGVAVGTLYQHDEDDADYVCATTGSLDQRSSIELIAILGCTIPRDEDVIWNTFDGRTEDADEYGREPPRTEEVYNVMWIIRSEGVAYRKATGIVKRCFWDKSACNLVEITLG